MLVNFLTHATVAWEISYCVLIWNRWTRPLVLLGAVAIHLGIVTALGMPTFGLAMLIANLSFVSPQLIRLFFEPIAVEGSSSRTSEATSELLSATSGRRVDGPTGDRLRTPLLSPSRPPRVKSK